MTLDQYFLDNEANWDDRARVHALSASYDLVGLATTPTALTPAVELDRDALGNLGGKDLIHLQCHIGTDTLSLARLGARSVTGLDLSGESLATARKLASQAGMPIRYVKANVYHAATALDIASDDDRFDVVYTGVGALWWLPNIDQWARVVAQLLRPGGSLVLREDHPLSMSLADNLDQGLRIEYPYFEHATPLTDEDSATYTDVAEEAPPITHPRSHGWNHGLGEIVTALSRAGLVVDTLEEFDSVLWERFSSMTPTTTGYTLPDKYVPLPLSYRITATKPHPQPAVISPLLGTTRDRQPLRIDDVHPQLRSLVLRAPHVDIAGPIVRHIARTAPRLLPTPKVDGVTIHSVDMDTFALRIYIPDEPNGSSLLWNHGGGMVSGAPHQDDHKCLTLASEDNITVVSLAYRLSPENPFPAAHHDTIAAWDWLIAHASALGLDANRIAVGGASAGGGLAAALGNHVRSSPIRPCALWLFYPMLDDRTAVDEKLDVVNNFIWNNKDNRVGWTAYLHEVGAPGDDTIPAAAAPARESDLSGLPPTWIGVGSIDLFYPEDFDYARKLSAAGVEVTFEVLPGAPHSFDSIASEAPITQEFLVRARRWLADQLSLPSQSQ